MEDRLLLLVLDPWMDSSKPDEDDERDNNGLFEDNTDGRGLDTGEEKIDGLLLLFGVEVERGMLMLLSASILS